MRKLLSIAALAIVALVLSGCGGEKKASLDYIAVKTSKDAKWGFVGPDGKMLYEEEFEEMPSPVIDGYFTVSENDGISVYKADPKKPELVPGCEDLADAGYMKEGLIPVTHKNERIKLVDGSGKERLTFMPVDGKEVISVSACVSDGILVFKTSDEKCGLMDKSGKVIIPARYDGITYHGEGMVMAYEVSEPDSLGNTRREYYLLDKKGKEIASFKNVMRIRSTFSDGHALVMKGDSVPGYIDKKGEFTKLPGKVAEFGYYFNGKEFSFKTEDDKTGVMNLKGEILIRPKYELLAPYGKDRYFAKDGESKWVILDKTGAKEKTYDDFEDFISIRLLFPDTKFEVAAAEKEHRIDFYTYDGESVTQESFYSVNFVPDNSPVYTDYFNAEEVGQKMASLIKDNSVNGIALGTDINKILPEGAKPETYSQRNYFELPDITGGYRWSLGVTVCADSEIASPVYKTVTEQYWYSTYTRLVLTGYKFNEGSKVESFSITAKSYKEFQKDAMASAIAALKAKGFTEVPRGNGMEEDEVVLKKGDTMVNVYSYSENENGLTLNVYKDSGKNASSDVAEDAPDAMTAANDSIAAPVDSIAR